MIHKLDTLVESSSRLDGLWETDIGVGGDNGFVLCNSPSCSRLNSVNIHPPREGETVDLCRAKIGVASDKRMESTKPRRTKYSLCKDVRGIYPQWTTGSRSL